MKTLSDKESVDGEFNEIYFKEDVKQFIKDLKELDIDLTDYDKKQIDKLAGYKLK